METNIFNDLKDFWPQDFLSIWPDQYILSISGGKDSMFLLILILELIKSHAISKPTLCYVNHQIRKEAVEDIEFITSIASRHQLDFSVISSDVPKIASRCKLSLEEAGRWVRYTSLHKLARKKNISVICTAHHGDDYLESVLMHLIRGGGSNAFQTMPLYTKSEYGSLIFRPLMYLPGQTIQKMVSKYQISFKEDHSNASDKFLRNRIRKKLMPIMVDEGLDTSKIWKNFHNAHDPLLPSELKQEISDCISIDRQVFNHCLESLYDLKKLLDIYFKVLNIKPANLDLLKETQKQALFQKTFRNSIHYSNRYLHIVATPRSSVWLILKTASCLKKIRVSIVADNVTNKSVLIAYNHIEKFIHLNQDEKLLIFEDGMRVKMRDGKRKKVKKIFQENNIPVLIRNRIPMVLNIQSNTIIRIYLSFWNGAGDLVFGI